MQNHKHQTQTMPTTATTPENRIITMKTKLIPCRFTHLSLLAALCCALAAPAHAGIVTSAADDGTPGTLRSAMAAAAPGDSITFDPSLTGQTITLTGGQLLIDKNLSITGPGAAQLTISGNHTTHAFQVPEGVSAMIEGLTIRDGYAEQGGAIYKLGTLTVSQSTLSGNSALSWGGGIYNLGTLTVSHSTLSGNSAPVGGGIYNFINTLTLSHSTLSGNSARFGGGFNNSNYGRMTVS